MNIQEMLHAERMRGYAARYRKANYRPPEPPHQPETVWDDLGSTFRTKDRKRRVTATGGGPSAVWFNQAKGGGSLERMIFG